MTRYDKILTELIKRTEVGTKDCTITMKCDGQKITIHPCVSCGCTEYFLVYSFEQTGFNTLEEVASYIDNYEEHKKEQLSEEEKIRKYFNEEISKGKGDWDWYSDWHKDVFGFRPRGMVCGQYVSPYATV